MTNGGSYFAAAAFIISTIICGMIPEDPPEIPEYKSKPIIDSEARIREYREKSLPPRVP